MTDDDDTRAVPFPVCADFEAAVEAWFAKHGRPTGPRPVIKQVGPGQGKKYPVKLADGHKSEKKVVQPFAYPKKERA